MRKLEYSILDPFRDKVKDVLIALYTGMDLVMNLNFIDHKSTKATELTKARILNFRTEIEIQTSGGLEFVSQSSGFALCKYFCNASSLFW